MKMKNVLSNQTIETKSLSKNKEAKEDKVNPNAIGATSDDLERKMGKIGRKVPISGA